MICSQKSEIKEDQQISGMERYEGNEIMDFFASNDIVKSISREKSYRMILIKFQKIKTMSNETYENAQRKT